MGMRAFLGKQIRRSLKCFVVKLPRELLSLPPVVSSVPLRLCWVGRLGWARDFSWLTVLLESPSLSPPKCVEETAPFLAQWVINLWHIHWAIWTAKISPAQHIIDSLVSYRSQPAYIQFGSLKTVHTFFDSRDEFWVSSQDCLHVYTCSLYLICHKGDICLVYYENNPEGWTDVLA